MLGIIIDNREKQLFNLMKERDLDVYAGKIEHSVSALDIGDIHICQSGKIFVFERKTVQDMIASIKDGRYKEQKQRLLASGHDCTYIIEGDDILSSRNERYQTTLTSAYLHTIYRDGIRIIYTKNIADTCTFILTLSAKIIEHPEYFTQNNQPLDYTDCVKMKTKKIENITPDVCFVMQLAQIPGISHTIAKNIQNTYPTMKDLIYALDASDDKVMTLCSIDKIGKEKAYKILQYLQY